MNKRGFAVTQVHGCELEVVSQWVGRRTFDQLYDCGYVNHYHASAPDHVLWQRRPKTCKQDATPSGLLIWAKTKSISAQAESCTVETGEGSGRDQKKEGWGTASLGLMNLSRSEHTDGHNRDRRQTSMVEGVYVRIKTEKKLTGVFPSSCSTSNASGTAPQRWPHRIAQERLARLFAATYAVSQDPLVNEGGYGVVFEEPSDCFAKVKDLVEGQKRRGATIPERDIEPGD